ncbi:hypothetical protein [Oceanicaulis sp.]|uniref:hypothetical protein n=1 Tax=Oceanicaulis sp. TaxID=1924941 RepID=UPI003F702392
MNASSEEASAEDQIKALSREEMILLAELGRLGLQRQRTEARLTEIQARLEGARLGVKLQDEERAKAAAVQSQADKPASELKQ